MKTYIERGTICMEESYYIIVQKEKNCNRILCKLGLEWKIFEILNLEIPDMKELIMKYIHIEAGRIQMVHEIVLNNIL